MTATEISEAITLSILSETPQIISDHEKFVAYSGYVVPYSSFCTIFMWALCGTRLYHTIWEEQTDQINTIKEMNLHRPELKKMEANQLGHHLCNSFKNTLKNTDPGQIENMIENFIDPWRIQ